MFQCVRTSSSKAAISKAGVTLPLRSAQVWRRQFTNSTCSSAIKQFLLADIGEGITECQLIQWFVQEGARVEQFDKLCEVQSDKASVEITSAYDGIIKKLHYETADMAITGKPLVDIDVAEDLKDEEDIKTEAPVVQEVETKIVEAPTSKPHLHTLATPAVRHLTKELNVDIADVVGTGRDGRVLKEDVHKHAKDRSERPAACTSTTNTRQTSLTPIQQQMFKTMTRSLSIPHFLYSNTIDMTQVTQLRHQLNSSAQHKVTAFAVIIKAVSQALKKHEILNAALDTSAEKPSLTYHDNHNFGIAVDTPNGLVVPVINNVESLSIDDIAVTIHDISERARNGKLVPTDFKDATFTISNIGSIGGGVVSPVISEPQVAILGIGRTKIVPAFDENGHLCKKEELVLSWSADHRVVDGATCARCAEDVRLLLETPATMLRIMR